MWGRLAALRQPKKLAVLPIFYVCRNAAQRPHVAISAGHTVPIELKNSKHPKERSELVCLFHEHKEK